MLTGDNRTTADAVARTFGIDHVEADVLPEQKATVVKGLQSKGERVAMAGDGINDVSALAHADAGIAMGTGTDTAMESAGVTLVREGLVERMLVTESDADFPPAGCQRALRERGAEAVAASSQ